MKGNETTFRWGKVHAVYPIKTTQEGILSEGEQERQPGRASNARLRYATCSRYTLYILHDPSPLHSRADTILLILWHHIYIHTSLIAASQVQRPSHVCVHWTYNRTKKVPRFENWMFYATAFVHVGGNKASRDRSTPRLIHSRAFSITTDLNCRA